LDLSFDRLLMMMIYQNTGKKVNQNFHTAVCNYNHDMINTAAENKNGPN